jgi:hypothetical protein
VKTSGCGINVISTTKVTLVRSNTLRAEPRPETTAENRIPGILWKYQVVWVGDKCEKALIEGLPADWTGLEPVPTIRDRDRAAP